MRLWSKAQLRSSCYICTLHCHCALHIASFVSSFPYFFVSYLFLLSSLFISFIFSIFSPFLLPSPSLLLFPFLCLPFLIFLSSALSLSSFPRFYLPSFPSFSFLCFLLLSILAVSSSFPDNLFRTTFKTWIKLHCFCVLWIEKTWDKCLLTWTLLDT